VRFREAPSFTTGRRSPIDLQEAEFLDIGPETDFFTECAEGAWQMVATGESELRIDAGGSIIRANEKRLRELFENLLRNAIEHGGSDVTVTVGSLPDGFYVEDDGTGIPEDARDDLFKMGYSTLDNGNGLGMSIVSEIAKTHNWEITIGESTDGGARFEFNEK
jgi:signal transduction histidine kinase